MKSGLTKLVGFIFKASETAKECGQFHIFRTFLQFFFGFLEAILKQLFQESETILFKHFLLLNKKKLGGMVEALECLRICVICVFKFQLFFLNLFSKVLAGIRVRTLTYPYNGHP